MTNLLKPNPVSIDRFTRDEGKLYAEISDLGGFGRVWNDSCDEGLTIIDGARETVYVVNDDLRMSDEVVGWELVPVLAHNYQGPTPPTVRVWND